MKPKKVLSYFFILTSFIFIIPFNITGNAVSSGIKTGNLFLGFSFLVFGIVLFMISHEGKLERNLAQEVRESGRTIDKSKDLIHIAQEMKYVLKDPVREGIPVYDKSGKYRITVIPIHKVSWKISKCILRDLANGEPSFRRRSY
jgi:hypothetical protein